MIKQCNIRVEENLKDHAQQIFKNIGISLSAAITIYLKECVRTGGIPFPLVATTETV